MIWRSAAILTRCLACCTPMVPLVSQSAETANDIQFSEPGRKVEFRSHGEIESRQGSTVEFLDRGNSLGGVISGGSFPSAPAGPAANPKMLEFFNRQFGDRRLRLDGTDEPDSQSAFEQAAGVNALWSTRTQGKTTEPDQFSLFHESPASNDAARDMLNRGRDRSSRNRSLQGSQGSQGMAGLESDTPESEKEIQEQPGAFELNRPLAAGVVLPTPFWNNSSPANRPGETPLPTPLVRDRADLQENRPDSLRHILTASGGINPLAVGFDPINLNVDVTRQAVNPVLPATPMPKLTDPAKNPLFDASDANLEKRFSSPESRSLGLRIEALGSSSLAPSISAPTPQPAPRPFSAGPTPFPGRRF